MRPHKHGCHGVNGQHAEQVENHQVTGLSRLDFGRLIMGPEVIDPARATACQSPFGSSSPKSTQGSNVRIVIRRATSQCGPGPARATGDEEDVGGPNAVGIPTRRCFKLLLPPGKSVLLLSCTCCCLCDTFVLLLLRSCACCCALPGTRCAGRCCLREGTLLRASHERDLRTSDRI
jgi:hypothetical protein